MNNLSHLQKSKLYLKKEVYRLCQIASKIMKQSNDPIHDNNHVFEMSQRLIRLIKKRPNIKQEIDIQSTLLSIYWHDTWKAINYTSNPLRLWLNDIFEGIGSANLFKRNAMKLNLDNKIISKVYYAIRKHSNYQILPTRSAEAKLLQDLDELEFWNFKRISRKKTLLEKLSIYKYFRKIYYSLRSARKLYFSELERDFKKAKTDLLKRLYE